MPIEELQKRYSVKIIPVNIIGRRWACGKNDIGYLPVGIPMRVQVSERKGFVVL